MACERDYSKALIYTIKTNDGLYVGSTHNFKKRKINHKSNIYNENNHHYNCKLYKNIRANDGDWNMEILHLFPCENGIELRQEEGRVMLELNANLNMVRAYTSEEETSEHKKLYYENNRVQRKEYREKHRDEISVRRREKVICECGCKSARGEISRHRKTKKHLNRMKLLDDIHCPV